METPKLKKIFVHEKNGKNKLLIYSPGLGVPWDFRELFPDIKAALPDYDFVYFNYSDTDEQGNSYVFSLEQQAETYKQALKLAAEQGYQEVNLLTHSLGYVVPCQVNSKQINKMLLLNPPVNYTREHSIIKLQSYPEHKLDLQGFSLRPRTGGFNTFIHFSFFDSLKDIDVFSLLNPCLAKRKIIITGKQDSPRINDYSSGKLASNIQRIELDGDHEFQGENRKALISEVEKYFN